MRCSILLIVLAVAFVPSSGFSQQYWNTDGNVASITAANWSPSPGGPFTTAYNATSPIIFGANSAITYVTDTAINGITVNNGFTVNWTAAGILNLGGAARTFTIGTGSILDLGAQDISAAAGNGVIKNGAGVLFMSNANNYAGGFILNAGTVIIGSNSALGGGGNLLTINGGSLMANDNRTIPSGQFSSIVIGGNFKLGGTTTGVNSGNATASANISFADPVSLGAANRTITIEGTGTYSFLGTVSGNQAANATALTVDGSTTGVLALSSGNTYTGKTALNGGRVSGNDESIFGANPAAFTANQITFSGGTFLATGNVAFNSNRGLTVSFGGGVINTSTFTVTMANAISGNGLLFKLGTGTLSFPTVQPYTGTLTVIAGAARVDTALALQNATVNVGVANGLTFGTTVTAATIGGLTGSSAVLLANTNSTPVPVTLTVKSAGTLSYAGVLSGAGGFVKAGPGTLSLTGNNNYTGATTVSGGTLQFTRGFAGGGSLAVGANAGERATLQLSTTGAFAFNGPLQVGASGGAGAVVTNSAQFGSTTTQDLVIGNQGYGAVAVNVGGGSNGGVNLPNAPLVIALGAGSSGDVRSTSRGTVSIGGGITVGGGGMAALSAFNSTIDSGAATVNITAGANGHAAINLQGSNLNARNVVMTGAAGARASLNVNGTVQLFAGGITSANPLGSQSVNLNGGQIYAAADNLTLLDASLSANGGVFVYNSNFQASGVNTAGFNATIDANLLRPTGNGVIVSTLANSGTLGAGYVGAPVVTVAGGSGTDLQAIANVSNGTVTGVTITNPGRDYQLGDLVTFNFTGGGFTSPAAMTVALTGSYLGANVSGPFIKTGSGTLTLSGTNTINNSVGIEQGTLRLSGTGSLAQVSRILMTSPASNLDVSSLTGGASFANGRFTLQSGQLLQGSGTVTGSLGVGPGTRLNPGLVDVTTRTLAVTENYVQTGGDYLAQLIGGGNLNTDFGLLSVAGSATVSGTTFALNLNTQTVETFRAAAGGPMNYTLITGGAGSSYSFTGTNFLTLGFQPGELLLVQQGNNMVLSYVPVPEPAEVLGVAALAAVSIGSLRRWRRD